jgi:hypothetical protein
MSGVLTCGAAFAQPVGTPLPPPAIPLPEVPPMPLLPMDASRQALLAVERARLLADHVVLDRSLGALRLFDSTFDFGDLHQGVEAREKAREAAARDRERDREGRLMEDAMNQVWESRWDRAVARLTEVAALKGTRADAALYWKAYAQDRQGQRAEALATLAALNRDFPSSRYQQQAKALEAEVRRNAGQPVRPQDAADEEVKLMALAALQHQAPEQAIPMLEKLLAGTASPKLKERALFVLAQSDAPRAREVLRGIAKGSSTPELQMRALTYLGAHGGPESRTMLAEIYGSTTDIDVKKRILRAFMVAGEKDRVRAAAQGEQNAELRATAVQQLGAMGAHDELAQLYAKETSVDLKKQIIQAMFAGGSGARMIELAKSEQNPELRRTAIRYLGLMGEGAKGSSDVLVGIYHADRDVNVKQAVIQALAHRNDATALVAIARKEQDVDLRKEIVARLSHMTKNKVATDYLLEILSK